MWTGHASQREYTIPLSDVKAIEIQADHQHDHRLDVGLTVYAENVPAAAVTSPPAGIITILSLFAPFLLFLLALLRARRDPEDMEDPAGNSPEKPSPLDDLQSVDIDLEIDWLTAEGVQNLGIDLSRVAGLGHYQREEEDGTDWDWNEIREMIAEADRTIGADGRLK